MWQVDGEAHRDAVGLLGTAVGGLHDARPTAGDDGEALFGQAYCERLSLCIHGVVRLGPRRPEDGDGRSQPSQGIETVDELAHDAQRAPGVGLEEGGIGERSLREQLAIVCETRRWMGGSISHVRQDTRAR